jgi:hypothetical protein
VALLSLGSTSGSVTPKPRTSGRRGQPNPSVEGGLKPQALQLLEVVERREPGTARVPRLAPGLLASPTLCPRLHLVPAPHSAAWVLGERRGEARLVGDLVGALLAHAEELGHLNEPERRELAYPRLDRGRPLGHHRWSAARAWPTGTSPSPELTGNVNKAMHDAFVGIKHRP